MFEIIFALIVKVKTLLQCMLLSLKKRKNKNTNRKPNKNQKQKQTRRKKETNDKMKHPRLITKPMKKNKNKQLHNQIYIICQQKPYLGTN